MGNKLLEKVKKIDITYIIMLAIFLIAIVPILYLAIYSRPCVDDYDYSQSLYRIVSKGNYNVFDLIKEAIKTDIRFYNKWQGLYISAFILSLQPGILGEQYYFIGTWLLIALMFGCLYFFTKTILKDILKFNKYTLLISIAVLTVMIAGLPSAVEGLYWFNGAWNYIPFFFLTLLNIALLLRYIYLDKKRDIIYSSIISFIISGGNHITSVLNIILLIVFTIFTIKKQKQVLIPLLLAIIGFLIMYFAPGTAIRQSYFARKSVIDTIVTSAIRTQSIIIYWFDETWMLTIIALIPIAYYIKKSNNMKKEDLKLNPIILLITKILLLFVLQCIPYKAMGHFGDGRLVNVIWLTNIVSGFIFWIYFFIWISLRIKITYKYKWVVRIILPIMLIGIIFGKSSNITGAINNIKSGEAAQFAYSCDLRYKQMKDTKDDMIYVEALPYNEMLRFDDVSSNTEDVKNKVWKEYYGKGIVIVKNNN